MVTTENFKLRVELPEGSGLSGGTGSESGRTSVSPTPTNIFPSEEGLVIEWDRLLLEPDESLNVILIYKNYVSPKGYAVIAAVIVGILLGGGGFWMYQRRAAPAEKKRLVSVGLSEEEKMIVNLVSEVEGEITQKELIEKTEYSKPKMSKIIRRLEEKGVIEKKPYQRTNKIYLTKDVK